MPIRANANNEAVIRRRLEQEAARMRKAVIRVLRQIGEEAVSTARSLPSPPATVFPTYPDIPPHQPHYMDHTANLRNSIGYVVVADGKIVTKGGFEGSGDGAKEGEALAKKLAARFTTRITLIVVAGMEYAVYVSAKGYDVLDSAKLVAEQLVNELVSAMKKH